MSALYVTSCVSALALLSGGEPAMWSLAFAFLVAHSVYLLDRVKLRDADLDPADEMAHPERAMFVRQHAGPLRLTVLATALGAVGVALASGHSLAAALVPCSLVGVAFYARSRERYPWRPKDLLVLKNPSVAGSIVAFALALHLIDSLPADSAEVAPLLLASLALGLNILADAALCDRDDQAADARYGTRTLPVSIGRTRARSVALCIKLAAPAPVAALWLIGAIPLAQAVLWGVAPVALLFTIAFVPLRSVRDAVDCSLAPVALASWALRAMR